MHIPLGPAGQTVLVTEEPQDKPDGQEHKAPRRQYFVPAPDTKAPSGSRAAVPKPQNSGTSHSAPRSTPPRNRPGPAKSTGSAQPPLARKAQPPAPARKRRRFRFRWLLVIPVVALIVLGFFAYRAVSTFNRIERVDLQGSLAASNGTTTNYLLVGSDSRAELDPEGSSGVTGSRADTIIVLRLSPEGSQMMSIPRDLWVQIADTGQNGRINGAFNRGSANLVRTVTSNLDIPINHYVEVGFGSFAGLVDSLGGVPIEFPYPAFDKQSGLNITEPGVHVLNGEQALAYARSRHFVEIVDGKERKDPTGDLGRQQRQQTFLRAALGALGESRNPIELLSAADSMSGELKVDDGLGMRDMFNLARKLGAASPETVVLPTRNVRKGKAAVLELEEPAAQEVLAGFR